MRAVWGLLTRMGLAVVLAALIVWLAVCVDQIATPRTDPQGQVDAVYVIGPVETRIDQTLAIMDTGVSPLLLATTSVNPQTGEHYATEHCGRHTASYRIECVLPDPYTTRGEARVLGEQARAHGWETVAVITSTPHAARTRLLMERCVDAEVLIWTYDDGGRSLEGWARAFVYQSGAWVKAQLHRSC